MFIASHMYIYISSFVNILFMTFADFSMDRFVFLVFRNITPLSTVYNFPSCIFLIYSQCLPYKSSSFLCRQSTSLYIYSLLLVPYFSRISKSV